MADTSPKPAPTEPAPGLKLRIWVGCIVTALLGAAGVLGVAGTFLPTSGVAPEVVAVLPWVGAGLPVLAGVLFAAWLAHGIGRPVRDMRRALVADRIEARRILDNTPAWGEMRALTTELQNVIDR